jgi:hypothetical protein
MEMQMGLFNSTVLDVAVGLVFVYLLLSIFCTAVNEWISGILQTRAKTLKAGISGLLDNQLFNADTKSTFLGEFYKHPIVTGTMQNGGDPSYLSSRTFSTTIMDLVTPAVQGARTFDDFMKGIQGLPDGDVKKALLSLISGAQGRLDIAQQNIEVWFDDSMDRVTGWYKRWAQKVTITLAVVITILANADTVNIAHRLWADPVVRSKVIEVAVEREKMQTASPASGNQNATDAPKPSSVVAPANPLTSDEEAALGRVLGWTRASLNANPLTWLQRILGWILTAIAVSLGAPFWFDTLSRFVNIRNAGPPPDKSQAQS